MGNAVHIKICGVTTKDDADACLALSVSAIGLNLVESSPRALDVGDARALVEHIAGRALTVLVVADQSVVRMKQLLAETGARCLQLHGDEPPDVVQAMLPHAYKAVRVGSAEDVRAALAFPGEHLLVDARVLGMLGGTGRTVDFALAAPLARQRKLTLAGGLHSGNVAEAVALVRPFCVDVASGVEVSGMPRRKDRRRLEAFVSAVRVAAEALEQTDRA